MAHHKCRALLAGALLIAACGPTSNVPPATEPTSLLLTPPSAPAEVLSSAPSASASPSGSPAPETSPNTPAVPPAPPRPPITAATVARCCAATEAFRNSAPPEQQARYAALASTCRKLQGAPNSGPDFEKLLASFAELRLPAACR